MLKINNLTKTYGKARGIDNINLNIEKGQVYGFIGPNGAGKSTTIKCIMNIINKNSGDIYIDGKKLDKKSDSIREIIGYLPSEINLYDDLTVREMLNYSASFYKCDCSKRIDELVKKLDIDLNKKIEQLSLGNSKKVGIVIAFMHNPKLVILDEATSGLDPLMQEEFYNLLVEEKNKGTTIFFSSHVLSEIKKICDKVAIIKEGKIIKIEDIKSISDDEFLTVRVYSKDKEKIKKLLKEKIIEEDKNYFKFIYNSDINKVIKLLNDYDIDKLLIEEPSIEEVFMHYYKED